MANERRARLRRAVVLAGVLVVAVLVGRAWQRSTFARALRDAAQQPEGTELRLADVADFAWDAVYVATPYLSPEDVDRAIGIAWGGAARSAQQDWDEVQLVVFVKGGAVVADREIGRELLAPGRLVTRAEAVFVVRGGHLELRTQ